MFVFLQFLKLLLLLLLLLLISYIKITTYLLHIVYSFCISLGTFKFRTAINSNLHTSISECNAEQFTPFSSHSSPKIDICLSQSTTSTQCRHRVLVDTAVYVANSSLAVSEKKKKISFLNIIIINCIKIKYQMLIHWC